MPVPWVTFSPFVNPVVGVVPALLVPHTYSYVASLPWEWLSTTLIVVDWLLAYVLFPFVPNVIVGAKLSNLNAFDVTVVQLPAVSQALAVT